MKNNIKNEMQKLCNMQIDMWNDIKNDLTVANNFTDKEICDIFHKHLRETHHKAVLQLVEVKLLMDEIEE